MIAVHLMTSTVLGLALATAARPPQPEGRPAMVDVPATVAQQVQPIPAVRAKRYCIEDRRAGVDIRSKVCRTREEWRARGFDPVVVIGGR